MKMDQETAETTHQLTGETLRKLQYEVRAAQQQLARAIELLEKQQAQLRAHDASIARLDRILMDMLTGRVWRTLSAAAKVAKRLMPRGGFEEGSRALGHSGKRSYLICDEPKASDHTPRSGKIAVKGWCLAEGGVDSVQVLLPGVPPVEAAPNVARPDVRKAHPDLDQTGRSGFFLEFDSLLLPNGRHPITIRLISAGMPIREAKTAVEINHEKGFATSYERWIHDFELPESSLVELKLATLHSRPLISVVMPVYNPDPADLQAAIRSVLNQSYSHWELCIADDCSSKAEVGEILHLFSREDSRIKLCERTERGGIARCSNSALELATGDFVCFLDHDDTLAPHALAYVCQAIERTPDADLLYSDEDKLDVHSRRYDPFFKPDWSPDLLLSENYINHLLVLRRDLISAIDWFSPDLDGSQDYDLVLRATAKAKRIEHIPRVLYHWRAAADSTALNIDRKQYAIDAAKAALERFCDSVAPGTKVEPGNAVGRWRLRYPVEPATRVSIIIASGGKVELLRTNLDSIFAKTGYSDFEVVIADNSKHAAIETLVAKYREAGRHVRHVDFRNQPFNYSAINNAAARACESPLLLFLNDDTSVIAPDWLEAMVELAVRPEVGAVGAKLLYPDGRIQHAGVVMGVYDNCGHAFKGLDGSRGHYFDLSDVIRNVSAVTGACLMTRSNVFWEVGGFDEREFAVAFNDVDLCLKIGALGLRVLYSPHALLFHHEAFSKTSKDLVPHPEEVASMRSKWETVIAADPYYNPNLTRNDEDYSLRTRN